MYKFYILNKIMMVLSSMARFLDNLYWLLDLSLLNIIINVSRCKESIETSFCFDLSFYS